MQRRPPPGMNRPRARAIGLFLLLCLVATFLLGSLPDSPFAEGLKIEGDGQVRLLIDLVGEQIKMCVTLTSAILASMGYLWTQSQSRSDIAWQEVDVMLAVLSLVLTAVSYYAAYGAYTSTIEMVAAGSYNVLDSKIQTNLSLQYHAMLLAFVSAGMLFLRTATCQRAWRSSVRSGGARLKD